MKYLYTILTIALLLPSFASAGIQDGLIGWFTLDRRDISKGVVVDKSGSGHSANLLSIASSTFYSSGKMAESGRFDGADDYMNAGTDFLGVSALTVSAWIYPTSYGEVSAGIVINNGPAKLNVAGDFSRVRWTNNGLTQGSSANNTVLLNRWTHVMVTRTSANITNIYINGVQNGTANMSSGSTGATTTATENVGIGNNNARNRTFEGKIDDVRVYNKALSASEVRQLYRFSLSKHLTI